MDWRAPTIYGGPGRPFVDLINWLGNLHGKPGYAELRVRRRQATAEPTRRDLELEDVQFAELFSGRPLPAGEDEILACAAERNRKVA